MSLSEQLMQELKDAMKSGDTVRRDTIRMVRSAIKNAEIDLQRTATDQEVEKLIVKEVKRRQESIEMFAKGGRQDLIDAEEQQLAILEEYLPKQLSDDAVEAIVREVIDEVGATSMRQMGAVMKASMARLQGQADGGKVNQLVRKLLS